MRGKFEHLFKDGKLEEETDDQPEESLGPCAARAKDRYVAALEIRHTGKAWEAFQYHGLAVRSEFEPTRFTIEFVDYPRRYRLVVKGRNLHRIYTNILQARMEWILAIPENRDHGPEKEPVIFSIEVVVEEEKR